VVNQGLTTKLNEENCLSEREHAMLSTLSIRTKISVGLAILTVLLLITSLTSYQTMKELRAENELLSQSLFPAEGVVINADRDLYQALTAQNQYMFINSDPAKRAAIRADFDENAQQALDRMHKYLSYMQNYPAVQEKLRSFETDFNSWKESSLKAFQLMDAGQTAQAQQQAKMTQPLFKTVREYYNTGTDEAENAAQKADADSTQIADNRSFLIVLIAIVSIGIGVLFSWFMPKIIVSSIARINTKVKDISQGTGDLVSRISVDSQDEIGALAKNMNQFLNKLQAMVQEIKQNSGSLAAATTDLNAISQHSEQLSNSQRRQLDGLVASFTEINQAIRDIAQHAQSAATQTDNAQHSTEQGMQLLQRNVDNSQQLSHSVQEAAQMIAQLADESEKITSVLEVIGSIAEQTNLLALNAAIEAARAGEQGRGFAVVADEVRTLASRTQKSTADIQQMIHSLKTGVHNAVIAMDKGTQQMAQTLTMIHDASDVLRTVQTTVTQVNEMNFQIAAATEQQSSVMENINKNLNELEQGAQQQVGFSRKTASSGQHLATVAEQLRNQLDQFRS
jgi:methyl-accepting chemotaxis protein